jgi:transposase
MKQAQPKTTPGKARRKPASAKSAKSATGPALNPQTHVDAAGIDIGAEEFVAALPPGRSQEPVRTFASFTSGVHALRDWLVSHKIKTVAMESTGNYWITLFDTLSAAGMEVYLVNASHVKGVPGKKTDVCDAQWLQQLHAAGLLKKSFRPGLDIVPLRYLMRHRRELVEAAAHWLQHMQKSLTEMNIKLHHVFSDIDGKSSLAIIDAILAGERDPQALAALRHKSCRSPLSEVLEALNGDYRPEYLFVLEQSLGSWRQIQKQIEACDVELGRLAEAVPCAMDKPLPKPENKQQHSANKNTPAFGIYRHSWRFFGVDLSSIPGVSGGLLSALISEVGTREDLLGAFRSPEAFASWMGLCPDNRISGGKVLKAKTRRVKSRLALALRQAVFGLIRSESLMGQYLRRIQGRLGKAEGITAAAHKLARIVYGVIKSQANYDETKAFAKSEQSKAKQRKRLEKQAAALGLILQSAA